MPRTVKGRANGRKEKYCLIHFFHPDFARCRIMDQKLEVGRAAG